MVRRTNGRLSLAEEILSEIGKRNHLEFTFTKDGTMFKPEVLAKYDAYCFFTSGDLTHPGGDGYPAGRGRSRGREFHRCCYQ